MLTDTSAAGLIVVITDAALFARLKSAGSLAT